MRWYRPRAMTKTAHGLSGLPMGDRAMGTLGYSRVYDLTIDYLKTFGLRVVEAGPHLAIMEPREGAAPKDRLRISWGRPDPGGEGMTVRVSDRLEVADCLIRTDSLHATTPTDFMTSLGQIAYRSKIQSGHFSTPEALSGMALRFIEARPT